jgi:L-asparaginase
MPKTKVYILYTGGTFGMKPSANSDEQLSPASWDKIIDYLPSSSGKTFFERFQEIEFTFDAFDVIVDSSNIDPLNWTKMAQRILDNYDQHDGFILIHGTDTMAYTASALSFIFQNLQKPVVLTGAQLPIFHSRSDAITNLSNAIYIAGYKYFNLPKVPEVCICFNDDLHRGNRSSKTSTRDFEGFYSPNFENLGWLKQVITININILRETNGEDFSILSNLNSKVVNVTLFPGYDPNIITSLIEKKQVSGIILRAFGSGNIPSTPGWKKMLDVSKEQKVPVLVVTQCPYGEVKIGQYESSNFLNNANTISGKDITTEAALTKMMWLLGNFSYAETLHYLDKNIRGEQSSS